MSLSTRCPSCNTTFKVVPDQLRISDGWVRCGHCGEVFDASLPLQAAGMPPPPVAQPARAGLPSESGEGMAGLPAQPDALGGLGIPGKPGGSSHLLLRESREASAADETGWGNTQTTPPYRLQGAGQAPADPVRPPPAPAEVAAAARAEPLATEAAADDTTSALLLQSADVELPDEAAYPPAFVPAVAVTPSMAVPQPPVDPLQEIGFVQAAQRRARWSQPPVVAALGVGCLFLLVVLGLQIGLHERQGLAAAAPMLRPWLVSLCRPLQCTVGAARQIDAVAIEGSAFNRRGADYQLSVDLRSSALHAVAMPALELTLTDAQDQTVVRRVLLPAEMRAPAVLEPRGSWSAALAVRLQGELVDGQNLPPRVAGYHLLAFYP